MVMVGPGEKDRYLGPFLDHLRAFCDEIRVRSEDPSIEWPADVEVTNAAPTFFQHEGRARQELLQWTTMGSPTHCLAIDADEFVADGQKLRQAMLADDRSTIWKLEMTEIWGADEDHLWVRVDGKWPPRPVGIAFEVPRDHWENRQKRRHWRIPDMAGGCPRVPTLIQAAANRTPVAPTTEILHLGWACKADRSARHQRYVHAGSFGHDPRHIASIMYDDATVGLRPMAWPPSLDKQTLLARINRR